MQYDLFADQEFVTQTPFTGRTVCVLGTFTLPTKQLIKQLCEMGADCKPTTKVSRNVHFVLVGENPPLEQIEALRNLNFNGYMPRIISEMDFHEIRNGHYASYEVPEKIQKTLHLTLSHYTTLHPTLDPTVNSLYTREIFVAPDTRTPQETFFQKLGDKGIYANTYIDDTTDMIIISADSLQRLKEGKSDNTIQYIEQQYNLASTQTFRYVILCEDEVLAWLIATPNDKITTP